MDLRVSFPFFFFSLNFSADYVICAGPSRGRKFCGAIGFPVKKGRSKLKFSVSSVATEISSGQVLFCLLQWTLTGISIFLADATFFFV